MNSINIALIQHDSIHPDFLLDREPSGASLAQLAVGLLMLLFECQKIVISSILELITSDKQAKIDISLIMRLIIIPLIDIHFQLFPLLENPKQDKWLVDA